MTFDPQADLEEAYAAAVDRCCFLRAAWEELGCPTVCEGSRRQATLHPLLKAMNDSELVANRLRQNLLKKHRGPEPSAVVQAKIGKSPTAKLRAAG